ncbi:rhodanese-like domain-containing protein [Pantoea sp. Aalb]|uniref:rhodanese-like domain-containing protein n=1 Tax=Pantoea sp. Aalb TaxID=2576762 RepID=UPI0013236DC2|nr:rhodanese-like domain-containing protein [Pantoea sp. Aalb]MXP67934.1 rhodanese-like domain-containing protein [Pantoea sp. Aalb]
MQKILQFVSNHPILNLVWIIFLILIFVTLIKEIFSNIRNINTSEMIHIINKEKAMIIDVRSYEDYKNGHIVGSIHIVGEDIKKRKVNELKKYKSTPIIVVCNTGQHASVLARELSTLGFIQVFVLKNGINAWNNDNLPLVKLHN